MLGMANTQVITTQAPKFLFHLLGIHMIHQPTKLQGGKQVMLRDRTGTRSMEVHGAQSDPGPLDQGIKVMKNDILLGAFLAKSLIKILHNTKKSYQQVILEVK